MPRPYVTLAEHPGDMVPGSRISPRDAKRSQAGNRSMIRMIATAFPLF
jgi:hypothetical protein